MPEENEKTKITLGTAIIGTITIIIFVLLSVFVSLAYITSQFIERRKFQKEDKKLEVANISFYVIITGLLFLGLSIIIYNILFLVIGIGCVIFAFLLEYKYFKKFKKDKKRSQKNG